METTYIIPIVIVVAIILLVAVLWPFGSHSASKGSSNTVVTTGSVSSTTSIPAVVQFYAVNVQYVYTGPLSINGTNCTYSSYTYIDNSQGQTLNGSQTFVLTYQPSSTICPMTITNIESNTGGFGLLSTVPAMPLYLPPNSQAQLQINMRAPNINFYGPITITIDYK